MVHYTGTLDDGTTFDSSAGREPLEFTLGEGMVIPGFEAAITGMSPGDKRKQRIDAANAYGDRDEERVIQMPRSELPPDAKVAVGDRVRLQDEMGHVHAARISDLGLETLTLDFQPRTRRPGTHLRNRTRRDRLAARRQAVGPRRTSRRRRCARHAPVA